VNGMVDVKATPGAWLAENGTHTLSAAAVDGAFDPDTIYVDFTGIACPEDQDFADVDEAWLPIEDDVPGVVIVRGEILEWAGVPPLPAKPGSRPHPILDRLGWLL
jgi:hypothetical protein